MGWNPPCFSVSRAITQLAELRSSSDKSYMPVKFKMQLRLVQKLEFGRVSAALVICAGS